MRTLMRGCLVLCLALPLAVKQETFFSDDKEVEGIQIPGKIVMKPDGKLYVEAEIKDPKPTDKIDAKVFAKP